MGFKSGFRDVRNTAELLSSGRFPKKLLYKLKNPFPPKVRNFIAKIKGEGQKAVGAVQNYLAPTPPPTSATSPTAGAAAKDIGKYALRGAAQVAAGVAGRQIASVINGKIGKVAGPAMSAVSKVQQLATMFTIGVKVVEELDPRKIQWPPNPGPAIDPVLLGANLAQTAARGVTMSLLTGMPIACGIPSPFALFKTLKDLKSSLRFFDPTNLSGRSERGQPNTTGGTAVPRVISQRGLLEDEIVYRLTLLAENVYKPMSEYCQQQNLGNLTILEGFRSENSGSSQHERGEAMDVTLPSPENLFRLAVWARDTLVYDQLVLCHSDVGTGQSWIHVSFSPETRRRQVLTKTFTDTFVDGLHIYRPYTNPEILSHDKAEAESLRKSGDQISQILVSRDAKLSPIGVNTPDYVKGLSFGAGGSACYSNPSIATYSPGGATTYDGSRVRYAEGTIKDIVASLLQDPMYLAMAQDPDRTNMVDFARRVVSEARSAGLGEVYCNALRGNPKDYSGDAIFIKNPTGAKGLGSWADADRGSIIDIVGGAHGGEGTTPSPAFSDVTDLCDNGGGALEP